MKIAGPYVKITSNHYRRYHLNDSRAHTIWMNLHYWSVVGDFDTQYSSKEAAMAALDKRLIDEGWTILNQEQFDKLKVLV